MIEFEFFPATEKLKAMNFFGIPTVGIQNGDLLAVWYGGGSDEEAGNYLLSAESRDGGGHWTAPRPFLAAADPHFRVFDPCLWQDRYGNLNLCFSAARNKLDEMKLFRSRRHGRIWSTPEYLAPGVALNKPAATTDGVILLPVAKWDADGRDGIFSTRLYASVDGGCSFTYRGSVDAPGHNCDEPMVIEKKSGDLKIFVRTNRGISESVSIDGGRTWPQAKPSPIHGASSRFFISRLRSGRLLMVNHEPCAIEERSEHGYPPPYGRDWLRRSNLYIYLSEDDGAAWPWRSPLDPGELISYPDATEDDDGVIHVVWDEDRYHLRRINHARITEAEIIAGKAPAVINTVSGGR